MLESLLIKLQALRHGTLLKKTPTQVFFCEICGIFKNTHFEEHLRTTASIYQKMHIHIMIFCITSINIYTFSEQPKLNKLNKLFININHSISKSNKLVKCFSVYNFNSLFSQRNCEIQVTNHLKISLFHDNKPPVRKNLRQMIETVSQKQTGLQKSRNIDLLFGLCKDF